MTVKDDFAAAIFHRDKPIFRAVTLLRRQYRRRVGNQQMCRSAPGAPLDADIASAVRRSYAYKYSEHLRPVSGGGVLSSSYYQ